MAQATTKKTTKAKDHPALAGVPVSSKTREGWLAALTDRLRKVFSAKGYEIPANLRVSCGWPASRALAAKGRAIGECWTPKVSADLTTEIFISPWLDDSMRVGDVLVHELVHAAVGNDAGHGPVFAAAAKALGLGGSMRATTATEDLEAVLLPMITSLGLYPHATLGKGYDRPADAPKKQGTRMLKCECPECGYVVRTTQKWLDVAIPTCPACEVDMVVGGVK